MHTTLRPHTVVTCQTYTDILYVKRNVQYGLLNQFKLVANENVRLRE